MTTPTFPTIHKPGRDEMKVKPNLEYGKVASSFSWEDMSKELDWLPGGWLNKAHEAIDRHANGPRRDKVAMIWEGKKRRAGNIHLRRNEDADQQVRQRPQKPWHREGRQSLSVHGSHPGDLYSLLRNSQDRRNRRASVLGIRP